MMLMRSVRSLISLTLLFVLVALSCAENGTIQLTTLPAISVADGRSTITVSAYVRRPSGQPVPDGTQVVFSTSLGEIKDIPVVQTINGVARVVLQAGTVPGTAKIKASALSLGAITTLDVEFLSDRSLLNSANEYVEIVAPGYMLFSLDDRILGAAGPNHGAKLRYREIEIEADDLQLNIPMYEVRAKKAKLRIGKFTHEFEELNLKLTLRKGIGTTTIEPEAPITAAAIGSMPYLMGTKTRFGVAAIRSTGIEPVTEEFDRSQFSFKDLSESTSHVSADKAVVFPQKKIQFQKAEMVVGGVKLLKLPLYEVSLTTASPVVTDQIFSLNNSQININYPHYLELKPGLTSLIRFTTGEQYGRTSGVNHGLSLNYELSWNRGDEFDGGLTLSGMTSNNWDLNARQYIRFGDASTATLFFDMPQGRSTFESLNYNKQFKGFGMSFNGSATQSLRGNRFSNNQVSLVVEKDPVRLGKLPFRWSYGFNANTSASTASTLSRSQSILGVHLRTQMIPLKIDGATQLNGYFTLTEQMAHNAVNGLAFQGSATVSRQLFPGGSALMTYDYIENGFSSGLTGRHQLSFAGSVNRGSFDATLSASRALDIDKLSLFADLSYRVSDMWRLSYSYTMDRYIGNTYVDYTAALGYRIGIREVGLTFSGRTKRFGFQILGAGFGY